MAQRYRSRAEWTKLVAELEASELTVAEFARWRKLSEERLQRWRSKLRRESQEQPSAVPLVEVVQAASAPQQAAAWLEVDGVAGGWRRGGAVRQPVRARLPGPCGGQGAGPVAESVKLLNIPFKGPNRVTPRVTPGTLLGSLFGRDTMLRNVTA